MLVTYVGADTDTHTRTQSTSSSIQSAHIHSKNSVWQDTDRKQSQNCWQPTLQFDKEKYVTEIIAQLFVLNSNWDIKKHI